MTTMRKLVQKLAGNHTFRIYADALLSAAAWLSVPKSRLSVDACKELLERYSPCPPGTCAAANQVDIQYDLQIVIPVYNVEKYVKVCLDSVLSQKTQYRILVTVVNDGSTDGSGDILRDYAKRDGSHCKIEIISQENRGFSEARNTGFKTIKGTYILFLDSDDILPPDTIETQLTEAYRLDADVLQGNWFVFSNTAQQKWEVWKGSCYQDGIAQNGGTAISTYAWGKLYKHTVLKNFQFPSGFWFEDTPVSFILAGMPFHFYTTSQFVYGYRCNPAGISAIARFKRKSIDSFWITKRCLEEFPLFGLEYDERTLECFLLQSMMSWRRTRKQPRQIREAIFVLTSDLMNHYFSPMRLPLDPVLQKTGQSLRERRFIRFELLALKWAIALLGNQH